MLDSVPLSKVSLPSFDKYNFFHPASFNIIFFWSAWFISSSSLCGHKSIKQKHQLKIWILQKNLPHHCQLQPEKTVMHSACIQFCSSDAQQKNTVTVKQNISATETWISAFTYIYIKDTARKTFNLLKKEKEKKRFPDKYKQAICWQQNDVLIHQY